MLSIKGTYDGKRLRLSKPVSISKPQPVIVTFVGIDYEDEETELMHLAKEGGAFDFLENRSEDIYTDDDLKVRY